VKRILIKNAWLYIPGIGELRNYKTRDLLKENHDMDRSFCSPSEKEPWSDESTFEGIGDISKSEICTWGKQNRIEDIAEEVLEWLREPL
jgi:hypothetical protein